MVRQVSADKRRLAEEDVKTVKEYYFTIANLAGDLIVRIDKDGRIVFLNDAASEFLGKPRKKLIGTPFVDCLHPEDIKKIIPAIQEMIKSKTLVKGFILRLKNPTGLRTIAWNAVPIFDESGNYVGTQATGKDLTEILRTEEELAQSKKHVQTLFNVIVDPMLIIELNGNILEISKSAEETTGFKREEIVGKHFLETTVGTLKTNAILTRNLQKIKKGMHIPVHTVELVTKDGRKLVCDLNLTKIMYRGETAILAIFHDITGEKKAEETLRQEREVLEMITGNMNAGLVIVSKDYRVLWANKIVKKHLGDIEGEVCYSVLNQRTSICPSCGVKEIFETGKDWVVHEQVVPVPDGQKVWLEISASAIRDENGNIVAASEMSRDITERKKAEKEISNLAKFHSEDPNPVFRIAKDGAILYANKAAQTLRRELERKKNQLVPRLLRQSVLGSLRSGLSEKVGVKYSDRIFSFVVAPVTEAGYVNIYGREITERKKIEKELQNSEERFRQVAENAEEWIWEMDAEGLYTYASPVVERVLGYTPEELVGKKHFYDLLHPEDQEKLKKAAFWVFDEKHSFRELINRNVHKNGNIVWLSTSGVPIVDDEGILLGYRGADSNITEQKKAEEALRESEEKYRELLNGMNDTVWVIDFDGNIIDVNDSAVEVMGYSREELLSMGLTGIDSNLDPEEIKGLVEGIPSDEIQVFETAHTTKDGKTIPVEISSSLVTYRGKQAILSIARNITERKQIEQQLKESEEKYRKQFKEALDAIVLADAETGVIVDCNRAATKLVGRKKSEIIGKHQRILHPPEEIDGEFSRTFKNHRKEKEGHLLETQVIRKTGEIRDVAIKANIFELGDKKVVQGVFRDITEQKKAEEALRRSEEEAKRLLEFQNKVIDTATVWVNLLDLKGNVILWNRAAELVSGYSREEVIGHNKMWKWLYPDPNYRAKFFDIGKEIIERGKRLEDFDSVIRCKDGSLKTISWYATNVLDEKGKPAGSVSVGIDVTERKKAQKAINNAMRLLRQSNEELESYTYVVSHDLKAPLRTIRSFGTFILEDYGDRLDETGQDYLQRMVNASSRMDSMIEDLLTLSRVGRKFTEFENVDLNKLLEEILADLEASIRERNAEVVVDKLPVISVQRIWMRQLFMNLINNALKFNDSKSPKIEVLHEERESDHLFKIRDNGIGIEEKYLERIFNLFERAPTQKKYEGTGAGLAICKKIVEQLEGKLWVESTPGEGSTFMFTIPKEIKKGEEE